MKILCHVHGYPPNHNAGAEWMLHHMLIWLQNKGHKVIVATADPGAKEFEGVQIIPEYSKVHIRSEYAEADIIISHLNRVNKVVNNIRALDKPALFLMHNTIRYSAIANIAHRSALCFNSEYTKSVPFYPNKDSCIVNPPCPTEYYSTNRGGAKYVTLINHCKQKGSDMFYALAKMLPDVEFMAVKGDYYHQEKEKLKNVTFRENTPDIKKAYQVTKILLMPSEYESWGRTAIEAAASGIPTIAAPTPGLKESLGKAGIFYDLEDQQGWANEIEKLLSDQKYYKERAELSKKRAKALDEAFNGQMLGLEELMVKAIDRRIK